VLQKGDEGGFVKSVEGKQLYISLPVHIAVLEREDYTAAKVSNHRVLMLPCP
jgi:hypothetical protein